MSDDDTATLGLVTHGRRIGIAWFIDGEAGGHIGEVPDRESRALAKIAKEHGGLRALTDEPYLWEEGDPRCKRALAAMRRTLKAMRAATPARPLPAWAKTALAAGWRAPKGWTP